MDELFKTRGSRGGFFSLFGLPPAIFAGDVLEKLGQAMARAQLNGSTWNESGYVYLAQFITHDITKLARPKRDFVPAGELKQLCTPALDLDCVYGAGPGGGNAAIDPSSGKMVLGRVIDDANRYGSPDDLPRRRDGTARIGDERNDENLLLAQLHVQFLKLHNFFVDAILHEQPGLDAQSLFERARQQTILHYQQVVLFDFLHGVLDPTVWDYVIGNNRGSIWNPTRAEQARMPIEFSAAAFRFGHAMVRDRYTVHQWLSVDTDELFKMTGTSGFSGKWALPDTHIVDWRLFFSDPNQPQPLQFLNHALPIDPTVPVSLPGNTLLAVADLRTGNRSLLPDAQSVIRHIRHAYPRLAVIVHLNELTPHELNPAVTMWEDNRPQTVGLLDLLGDDYGLQTKTPLWYYVLVEAHVVHKGKRLGPLGSLIVAEVLRALVRLSTPSILHGSDQNFMSKYIKPTKNIGDRQYLRMIDLLNALWQTGGQRSSPSKEYERRDANAA